MRVDIERHFEGIPRTAIRDIVATCKPKGHSKTIETIKKLQNVGPMFGHTLEDFKAAKTKILPNIREMPKVAEKANN